MNSSIRVRFAPSPTGHLHIGSLRSALFNWLFARHHNGTFLLRIEDTDLERSKNHFLESLLEAFSWVGITSDEPLITQSARISLYQKIAQELIDKKLAYRCYCGATDYDNEALETHNHYAGTCRTYENTLLDKPYAIRFKLPNSFSEITFNDLIRGPITISLDQLDDFIIIRSDGMPMYNFAVVVDDAAMRISHIIRGEEHIVNTPKQLLLYNACNYKIPLFAHIPLILGPSGEKLSKRDGALSVLEYKKMGYIKEALMSHLARLGWSHGDQELFSKEELIKYFSLDHVGKKSSIFDSAKLNWVNKCFIETLDNADILMRIKNDLEKNLTVIYASWQEEQILYAIQIFKERSSTLLELGNMIEYFCAGSINYDHSEIKYFINNGVLDCFNQIKNQLPHIIFKKQSIASLLSEIVKKNNIHFAILAKPLRYTLMGTFEGPSLADLILILGVQETIKRIQICYTIFNKPNT